MYFVCRYFIRLRRSCGQRHPSPAVHRLRTNGNPQPGRPLGQPELQTISERHHAVQQSTLALQPDRAAAAASAAAAPARAARRPRHHALPPPSGAGQVRGGSHRHLRLAGEKR